MMQFTNVQTRTLEQPSFKITGAVDLDGVTYVIGKDHHGDCLIHTSENEEPFFLSKASVQALIAMLAFTMMNV